MPTDGRRVSFREDKSRSGSSRSSTLKSDSGVGSSSTGSSYSGTVYPGDHRYKQDPLYELSALKEALADSEKNVLKLRDEIHSGEQKYQTLRKEHGEAKSRVQGLEDHCAAIEDDKRQLQREKSSLKDENRSLKDVKDENRTLKDENKTLRGEIETLKKKLDKAKKNEKQSTTTSPPESNKMHRTGSKHSKDSDSDKEKSRLKERFVPRNENSSETNSSNQSNAKTTRGRRMSNATYADRTVYIEPYGQGAPRPSVNISPPSSMTNGGRRFDGYVATSKPGYTSISTHQEPVYSSTPRSATDRPSVIYQYPDAPLSPNMNYEDGNYHAYPLPPRR